MATHSTHPETTIDNIQSDCSVARLMYKDDVPCFNVSTVQFLLNVIKEQEKIINKKPLPVATNNSGHAF